MNFSTKTQDEKWYKDIGKIAGSQLGFCRDSQQFIAIIGVKFETAMQNAVILLGRPGEVNPEAGNFLCKMCEAFGVLTWEQIPGRLVYALKEEGSPNSEIKGFENLPPEPGCRIIFDEMLHPETEEED